MEAPLKTKILIVDDDQDWHDVTSRHLSSGMKEISLYPASNYEEAMDLIARHFFHAAVLDVRLVHDAKDNEEGMKLLKALSERGEATGIVMLSGFATPQRVRDAWRKYGAVDFLEKENLQPESLVQGLKEAIIQSSQYMMNCRQTSTDLKFLSKKVDLESLIERLPYETQENFQDVVRYFVVKLAPMLVKGKFEHLEEQGKNFRFSTKYWSRYGGESVAFEIGSRLAIEEHISLDLAGLGSIDRYTKQNISGIKYVVSEPDLQEFLLD